MNASERRSTTCGGRALAIALGICILTSSAHAAPVRFSASGSFDLQGRSIDLAGVSDATAEAGMIQIGTLPVGSGSGPLREAPFHLKFTFDGLPAINVEGTIPWIGYNPDVPVQDVIVTTAATAGQAGLYPELFQRLLANPDWLHTSSFRVADWSDMPLAISVHPRDPDGPRPVPEPAWAVAALMGAALLAARRRRRAG